MAKLLQRETYRLHVKFGFTSTSLLHGKAKPSVAAKFVWGQWTAAFAGLAAATDKW